MPGGLSLLPGRTGAVRAPVPIPLGLQTLGSLIPVTAGQRAIIGQVIWCGEFKRVGLPVSQRYWRNATGGSIGLPGEVTTTIGVDFAMAFGYPLVPGATLFVGRIWIDNGAGFALAYDAITNTVPAADSGINFTLYKGDTTQNPDATMLSVTGELTPGYNNLIYMVFHEFPTGAVKIPSIKVEFFGSTDILDVYTAWTKLEGSPQIDTLASFFDQLSNQYFGWSDTDTASPAIHIFDAEDGEEIEFRNFSVDPSSNGLNQEFALFDPIERIVFTTESPASNGVPLISVDVDGGGIAARFGTHTVNTASDDDNLGYPTHGAIAKYTGPGPTGLSGALLLGTFVENELVLFTYGSGSITFKEVFDIAAGATGQIKTIAAIPIWTIDGFSDKLKASGAVQQDCSFLVGLNSQLWQYDFGIRNDNLEQINSVMLKDYGTDHNIVGIITDVNSRKCVVVTHNFADGFGVAHVYGLRIGPIQGNVYAYYKGLVPLIEEYQPAIGGMVPEQLPNSNSNSNPLKEFQIPPPDSSGDRFENICRYTPLYGKIAYQSGAVFTLMDYQAGTAALRPIPEAGGVQEYFFDARSNSAMITGRVTGEVIGTGRIQLDVPGPSGLTIGIVCQYLAILAGYDNTEIYVDPLLTDPVLGVIVNQAWTTSDLFRNLGQLYDFQTFESEGKIKFIRTPKGEGAHTAESLTLDTLAPIGEGEVEEGEAVITAIDEPENVPAGVAVDFYDPDMEYELNTRQFNNNQAIAPVSNSVILKLAVPIVMETDEAYTRASRVALGAYELSVTQQFRLPWRFSQIEPSDLVDITVSNFQYIVQVTEVTFNGDFSLSCFGRNYAFRDDIAVSDDGNQGAISQPLPGSSNSKPIILDMPYILGSDDSGQIPTAYGLVTSYGQFDWAGSTFWRGPVTGSYQADFASDIAAVTGATFGTLPDTETPWQTDYETELRLILRTGGASAFVATDRAGLLSGLNAIVVGRPGRWELIYFQDVSVIDDRNVIVSTLLRGRRGTEVNVANHEDRDEVILVASVASGFDPFRFLLTYSPNAIGESWKYKAAKNSTDTALEIVEAYQANSLRPFAVAYLRAEILSGDDVLISWFRRTRVQTDFDEMVGFPTDIPLAEQSEAYEIEIYAGSTLVRTLTAGTNSVVYTTAQQIADGFTPPIAEEVTFKAYQLSAVAGRGFGSEITYASV